MNSRNSSRVAPAAPTDVIASRAMTAPSLSSTFDRVRAVEWVDGRLRLIDQRLLPAREEYLNIDSLVHCATAIRDMTVRGAPAIGIAAAYGVVLAARDRYAEGPTSWARAIQTDLEDLAEARPTAVNLR